MQCFSWLSSDAVPLADATEPGGSDPFLLAYGADDLDAEIAFFQDAEVVSCRAVATIAAPEVVAEIEETRANAPQRALESRFSEVSEGLGRMASGNALLEQFVPSVTIENVDATGEVVCAALDGSGDAVGDLEAIVGWDIEENEREFGEVVGPVAIVFAQTYCPRQSSEADIVTTLGLR